MPRRADRDQPTCGDCLHLEQVESGVRWMCASPFSRVQYRRRSRLDRACQGGFERVHVAGGPCPHTMPAEED